MNSQPSLVPTDANIGIVTALHQEELDAVRTIFECEEPVMAPGERPGRTYWMTELQSRMRSQVRLLYRPINLDYCG